VGLNELHNDTDLLKCRIHLNVVIKPMKNGGEKNQRRQCSWAECRDILTRMLCVLVSYWLSVFTLYFCAVKQL